MITQSLLIKTAYSYRNELIDLVINKGFIGPDSRYEALPYMLISLVDDMKMFIPIKEAKGKQVYYVCGLDGLLYITKESYRAMTNLTPLQGMTCAFEVTVK